MKETCESKVVWQIPIIVVMVIAPSSFVYVCVCVCDPITTDVKDLTLEKTIEDERILL